MPSRFDLFRYQKQFIIFVKLLYREAIKTMQHKREDVIQRITQEFERLDCMVANLTYEEWAQPLPRPETKDPWTVKDGLAHITYWKERMVRSIRKQPKPAEERGLALNAVNHLIYERWRGRSPQEVLSWHRQVQNDALSTLQGLPEEYFAKERSPQWPADLDGHSAYHRVKDIERTLEKKAS